MNSAAQPAREARTTGNQAAVQGFKNDYDEDAKEALRSMSPSEHKKIKYNDPRLDAYTYQRGIEKDMEWAIPLLLAIRNSGEKSNNNQTSPKGAKSVMQFMPDTWHGKKGQKNGYKWDRATGRERDLNNPADTIDAAYDFVQWVSKTYNTKDPAVIAAYYNGGHDDAVSVQKTGKAIHPEAQKYVPKVILPLISYFKFKLSNVCLSI